MRWNTGRDRPHQRSRSLERLNDIAATLVPNSKSLPHRLRINAEQIADIDESKRPVAPLGCDPFGSLRGLGVRHAAARSLKATHSVLEYCRDERYLREVHACPLR